MVCEKHMIDLYIKSEVVRFVRSTCAIVVI